MKRTRCVRAVTALLVGAAFAPCLCLGGSINGKVVLVGSAPPPRKLDVTIDQYVCGNTKDAGDLLLSSKKEISNAVVWLDNPPAGAAPARFEKAEMDQKGCVFVPRVLLVAVNGTVDFLNSDRLLHNLHATPKLNASFNRTQPKSRTISITFDKPEIVRINCDLHSWMVGWVVVAAHPYYTITGADGQFSFDNLPPGQYKLQVWHEVLGTVPASVTVESGEPARVTVEMKTP